MLAIWFACYLESNIEEYCTVTTKLFAVQCIRCFLITCSNEKDEDT